MQANSVSVGSCVQQKGRLDELLLRGWVTGCWAYHPYVGTSDITPHLITCAFY